MPSPRARAGGAAQTAEQFYKGKTINFLVASVPGGVNDLTARLIARHLGKHIPGNPTSWCRTCNRPGWR